ncbi:MAG TPA: TIGR03032 family protein [Gemmata sp.]|jgi:uncharacterized protein (TIGR03032 family)|nr:TIGR03032 family protein [Gemmata sp.]
MPAALMSHPVISPGRYFHSANFPELLLEVDASLLVSTYQAGKLIAIRAGKERLSSLIRTLDRPMGIACRNEMLAVGTRGQVWFWQNAPQLSPELNSVENHDACYVPRSSHVTGDIRIHEMAWAGNELWFVNTRFSCLCTLHPNYSFIPRWRPPFISALVAEDRCHINGLAVVGNQPRYVTALGETDTKEGWRDHKSTGGCMIDVENNTVLAHGLCMPHSPRWHADRLWVLDSGTGRLLVLDHNTGRSEVVATLPGYVRGLAFCGGYAFVGLSKIRETAQFGGLPISNRQSDLKCGVWVVDTSNGDTVGFLEFETDIEEIFDVQMLAGCRFPNVIGLQSEIANDVFVLPMENSIHR